LSFLKIGGIVHHYLVDGAKDKPALVFSNSLGSDLRTWDSVVPHFVPNFKIVRYDKRGHGLTDAPAPPYSLDDLALDLVGLLDNLEIKEAVVCGLSVGGLIAQRFALSHPERVRALVLCDTAMRIGSVASWEERIATVRQSGLTSWVNPSMERWFSPAFRERHNAEVCGYANMLLRMSVQGYIGTCYALRDADLTALASTISKPTLVLCGDQDIATPPALGQELARAIPGARFSLIRDAAHLSCVEQPEALARQMIQFFREVNIG
jgi:3-oxoadipate enol-lactonase